MLHISLVDVFVCVEESRNRLSHLPCQQSMVDTASTMAAGGAGDAYLATAVANNGQHISMASAWPTAAPSNLTPHTESTAGAVTATSLSAGFHCSQNVPLSAHAHVSDVHLSSQPFGAFAADESMQLPLSLQNDTSATTNPLVLLIFSCSCYMK